MSPQLLVLPESEEAVKKQNDEGMSKGHRANLKELPNCQSWNDFSNKIRNIALVTNK